MLASDRGYELYASDDECYLRCEAGRNCTKQPGRGADTLGPLPFNNKAGDLGCAASVLGTMRAYPLRESIPQAPKTGWLASGVPESAIGWYSRIELAFGATKPLLHHPLS
jgi:hypothetical protein